MFFYVNILYNIIYVIVNFCYSFKYYGIRVCWLKKINNEISYVDFLCIINVYWLFIWVKN